MCRTYDHRTTTRSPRFSLLALLLVGCWLTACGSPEPPPPSEAPQTEPISDSTRFRQTVADVEDVGIAVMSAMVDNPSLTSGAGPFAGQELYELLHPSPDSFYMKEPPLIDGWGSPLEVFINSSSFSAFSVLVRSAGSDGEWETGPYEPGHTPQGAYDRDIVWTDGYFLRDLR